MNADQVPAWVSPYEQQRLVKGRIDSIVAPYREEAARVADLARADLEQELAASKAKADAERRVQGLIDHGTRYAEQELREFARARLSSGMVSIQSGELASGELQPGQRCSDHLVV